MSRELDSFVRDMYALRGQRKLPTVAENEKIAETLRFNIWQAQTVVLGHTGREVVHSEYKAKLNTKKGVAWIPIRVALGHLAERCTEHKPPPHHHAPDTRWLTINAASTAPHRVNYWPHGCHRDGRYVNNLTAPTPRRGRGISLSGIGRDDWAMWLEAMDWDLGRFEPVLMLNVRLLSEVMHDVHAYPTVVERAEAVINSIEDFMLSYNTPLRVMSYTAPGHRDEMRARFPGLIAQDTIDPDLDRITLFVTPHAMTDIWGHDDRLGLPGPTPCIPIDII